MAQGTYHFAESMLTHTNWNTKAWYWTDIWSMQLSSLPGAIQDMSAPVSIQRCPNALYGLFSRRNVSWVSSKVLVWGGFQRPKRLQVQWLSSRDVKRRVQATKLWTKWEGVSWEYRNGQRSEQEWDWWGKLASKPMDTGWLLGSSFLWILCVSPRLEGLGWELSGPTRLRLKLRSFKPPGPLSVNWCQASNPVLPHWYFGPNFRALPNPY